MTRVPWVTLAFVAAASAAALVPAGAGACEFDRGEVAAGALWRPFTAQLVHWTARMAATDLGAVLLLGAVLEGRSRRAAVLALVAGLALVAAGLVWLPPPVSRYRGSSSLASALYVALALDLGRGTRSPAVRGGAALAIAALLAKGAFEAATGRALFAGPMPPGVAVLPRAHLLGGLGGALGWWIAGGGPALRNRQERRSPPPGPRADLPGSRRARALSAPCAAPSGPSWRSS